MKCLAELLPGLKDPRLQGGMLSIVRCETTPDLRWCKVYISALGQFDQKELIDMMPNLDFKTLAE